MIERSWVIGEPMSVDVFTSFIERWEFLVDYYAHFERAYERGPYG